jgi:hypothetical protein
MFEKRPPGQALTTMRPVLRSGESSRTVDRPMPTIGMTISWSKVPTAVARGLFAMRRKSSVPNVRPIANINANIPTPMAASVKLKSNPVSRSI